MLTSASNDKAEMADCCKSQITSTNICHCQFWSRQFFTQPAVAMVVTNIRCGQLVKQGFRMVSMREDEDSLDYDLTSSFHAILHTSGDLDLVNHK